MHCFQWSSATVIVPLTLSAVFFVLFVFVEFHVAPEPVLAPFLLKQKIPVLVGISNFLVATCNFSVTYFFPMWFQVVASTSASTAGGFCKIVHEGGGGFDHPVRVAFIAELSLHVDRLSVRWVRVNCPGLNAVLNCGLRSPFFTDG